MLMTMMLDYFNLLVEYVIMSVPIISPKENYHIFNCKFIGGDGGGDGGDCVIYIYIFIHGYNFFLILYNDGVVLVWMIEYQYLCFALSIIYPVLSYCQRIMTTNHSQ